MTDAVDADTGKSFGTGTSFHGRVDLRHFTELNAATLKRLNAKQTFDWRIFLVFAAVFIVAAIALFKFADANVVRRQRGQLMGGAEIAVDALVCGALFIDVLYRIFAYMQNTAYRTGAVREDGGFLGERRYTMSEDGLHVDGKYGTSLSRWQVFTDLSDAPSTVLLWTEPGAAIMVPKDAIGDDAAVDAFKAAVMARIAARS